MRMRADDYENKAREEKTRLKSTVVSKVAAAVGVEYGEEQVRLTTCYLIGEASKLNGNSICSFLNDILFRSQV